MSDNVLYYPFIRVPNSEWFTRVLLYWDTVGSIVPYEYTQQPERLGQHMQSLLTEGLVRQIIPKEHLHRVREFADSFVEFAHAYKTRLRLTPARVHTLPTSRVHIEKLGNIGERLSQMGLARRSDYPWYDIESKLAARFMACLAGLLSKVPDFDSHPITDQLSQIDLFETPDAIRRVVLQKLLPAPSGGIPAADLARFKSRHAALLRRFRNKIELFILQVGAVQQPRQRKAMIDLFTRGAQDRIEEIVDAMRTQGWRRITLGRFLSYSAAGVSLADAIASGGLLSIIAAGLTGGGAIHATIREANLPNSLQGSFVAYAAIARKLRDGRNGANVRRHAAS